MSDLFPLSERAAALRERLRAFIRDDVEPAEAGFFAHVATPGRHWTVPPVIETLKARARELGLWNLFLKDARVGAGLGNLEYAQLAEEMGRSPLAPEACNCSAPDTGNMETIARYGSEENKARWLKPLLEGKIRSAFAMTEPDVASSDATNIATRIERQGNDYVINGRKWWTSGAGDPRCKIYIFMGKTDPSAPKHAQQSMVLVPAETPGVKVLRPLNVFGFDDAPHGHMEVLFENVRVPVSNILLGEGRGFEIAQGRLGPGRIHHCMRTIGLAERALELMCRRASARVAFGKTIAPAAAKEREKPGLFDGLEFPRRFSRAVAQSRRMFSSVRPSQSSSAPFAQSSFAPGCWSLFASLQSPFCLPGHEMEGSSVKA